MCLFILLCNAFTKQTGLRADVMRKEKRQLILERYSKHVSGMLLAVFERQLVVSLSRICHSKVHYSF